MAGEAKTISDSLGTAEDRQKSGKWHGGRAGTPCQNRKSYKLRKTWSRAGMGVTL